ncbi:type II toxin-antitoxin system RelE/ParE family toxin [Adhaeribacter swui]|uniref:Type II toxin-antitoxin system RelE/ParE family toxin n=1 Tax=Adhaeribacter swui TaxID=2086471 RepID=A0A7G7G748_9BACT|nr:type II toxin-antitoxin system RelE/ParE family toxin [Adhaeribacter swui]QNF32982.1 type II toxin-antitoxin system RelE/ParE family toxin [Adhaeribacter swui]
MVKKIVWTIQAKDDRREILTYWFERTGNKKYSQKLAYQFRETVKYIATHNYLGRATDTENVRVTVSGNYLIFYKLSDELVEVITVFDSRRNPEELKIIK